MNHNHMPGYSFHLDGEIVEMGRKAGEPPPPSPGPSFQLNTDTYDVARTLAPGWDVHAIEADWRDWISNKSITPWHADRHFLAFCKRRGKYPGFK